MPLFNAQVSGLSKQGDSALTGEITLSEGTNITLTQVGQDIEIASTGGGGGAPAGADYVVVALNGSLTHDRQLAAGSQMTLTDAGAKSTITLEWSPNPFRMARFWHDGAAVGDFGTLVSGTSAAVTFNTANSDNANPGVAQSTTGTTSTGRACNSYLEPVTIQFGTFAWRSLGEFQIRNLSDGTETYTATIGFQDTFTSGVSADGAYFRYTHSVNGGRYECVTVSNSVSTVTDSGVTAIVNVWVSYEIRVNAAGTSVEFYLNGSLVQTHTTNIPTGSARRTGHGHNIIKSLGATARLLLTDFCLVEGLVTR
jgi:hypothetical protein